MPTLSIPRRRAAALVLLLAALPVTAGPLGDFAERVYQATRRAGTGSPTEADIGRALREVLAQGATRAVTELGRTDGYWQDARFRIPLPKPLARHEAALRAFGAGPRLDALHLAVNRAAESAVPAAAEVFAEAVRALTLAEVRTLLDGQQDAATQYFRRSSDARLVARLQPIVAGVTAQSGLARQYRDVVEAAGPLATVLGAPDLDAWVTRRALDGLYQRMADEEGAIRRDPAARGSDLLRRVFARPAGS